MLEELENYLKSLNKVAVAFSGGIDSSFLVCFANKVLPKGNVLAIIANGQMIPRKDYSDAIEFLKENEIPYREIPCDALETLEFRENHKDRCYHCKKSIMTKVKEVALQEGFENVLDGNNLDDTKVYRPGHKVVEELGIISPLEKNGFTKADIRKYSKQIGIKFWNKPSNSCLATRFPYNTVLTNEGLEKVDKAEEIVKKLGILSLRVRVHDDIARIEVNREDFSKILDNLEIVDELKQLGFRYVTLDLAGLQNGSFDK